MGIMNRFFIIQFKELKASPVKQGYKLILVLLSFVLILMTISVFVDKYKYNNEMSNIKDFLTYGYEYVPKRKSTKKLPFLEEDEQVSGKIIINCSECRDFEHKGIHLELLGIIEEVDKKETKKK